MNHCLAIHEHCGCLECNSIVLYLNCYGKKKGHMSRKGSFDFHMPVTAKETTSSAITYSACLCFWLPHKLHFGAVLRDQQGYLKSFTQLRHVGRTKDALSFLKFSRYPWMEPLRLNRMSEIRGKWPVISQ